MQVNYSDPCRRPLIGEYLPLFLHWILICKPSCLDSCVSSSSFWSCPQNFTKKLLALTLTKKETQMRKEGIRIQREHYNGRLYISSHKAEHDYNPHYWLTGSLHRTFSNKKAWQYTKFQNMNGCMCYFFSQATGELHIIALRESTKCMDWINDRHVV